MGGGITAVLALVAPRADDLPVALDDAPDRHVAMLLGPPGLLERELHPGLVSR
jgi:hypothetical protein